MSITEKWHPKNKRSVTSTQYKLRSQWGNREPGVKMTHNRDPPSGEDVGGGGANEYAEVKPLGFVSIDECSSHPTNFLSELISHPQTWTTTAVPPTCATIRLARPSKAMNNGPR